MQFDGQNVTGTLEILGTPKGKIVASLIRDKVTIGFSLRSLGQVDASPDGTLVVTNPQAVTYDIVSQPSDYSASVIEVMNESTDMVALISSLRSENNDEVLTESVCGIDGCIKGINQNDIVKKIIEESINDTSAYRNLKITI